MALKSNLQETQFLQNEKKKNWSKFFLINDKFVELFSFVQLKEYYSFKNEHNYYIISRNVNIQYSNFVPSKLTDGMLRT